MPKKGFHILGQKKMAQHGKKKTGLQICTLMSAEQEWMMITMVNKCLEGIGRVLFEEIKLKNIVRNGY
jgi:hypothetical protein